MHERTFRRHAALECGMGKFIYLDHFRPQQPDLPPNTLCGGLITLYVVDASVLPTTRRVIVRRENPQKLNAQPVSKVSALPVMNERGEQIVRSIKDPFVKSRPIWVPCMTLLLREIEEARNPETDSPESEQPPRF